jgi:hypothetical protein
VIDQPGASGSLAVCVARRRGCLSHRCRDALCAALGAPPGRGEDRSPRQLVLADTARAHARRLYWHEVSDETLERLRVLGGYYDDPPRTSTAPRTVCSRYARRWSRCSAPGSTTPSPGRCSGVTPPTALGPPGGGSDLAKRHAPRLGTRLVDRSRQRSRPRP